MLPKPQVPKMSSEWREQCYRGGVSEPKAITGLFLTLGPSLASMFLWWREKSLPLRVLGRIEQKRHEKASYGLRRVKRHYEMGSEAGRRERTENPAQAQVFLVRELV